MTRGPNVDRGMRRGTEGGGLRHTTVLSPPSSEAIGNDSTPSPCLSFPIYERGEIVAPASYDFFFFLFWLHHMAYRILSPQSGIELWPSALKAWSLNHWAIYGMWSVVKGTLNQGSALLWLSQGLNNLLGFLGSTTWEVVKNLLANEGDLRDAGSIPGSGRSP